MISFTTLQVFELLIGTVALFLFFLLFSLVLWSSRQDPNSGSGCSLILLSPLAIIAIVLLLSAFL